MTKILKFLQVSLVILGLFFVLVPAGNFTLVVHAQNGISSTCSSLAQKKTIKFTDLFYIGNFLPLIPEQCGLTTDGNINPLPFYFIFDIIIRTAGFLFSFAFYMLPVAIIIYGARILFLPFDPKLNKNEFQEITTAGRTITRELSSFIAGLLIIIFSYTLVFTILGTLQIESTTDLTKFFDISSN